MTNERSSLRYLQVQIGGEAFALSLEIVREILPMAELTRATGLPWLLEGHLRLGSHLHPVLRVDRLLGLAEIEASAMIDAHLVHVITPTGPLILLVNRATRVIEISESDYSLWPEHQVVNRCLTARITQGEEVLPVISVPNLLHEQERRAIREHSALQQDRLLRLLKESA